MAESTRLVAATTAPADGDNASKTTNGGGSSLDTILNIVNIAFGAGMLGLPYAIQGAGFVSGIVGMGIVLFWNFYCCSLLVQLRNEVLSGRANASKGSALSADLGSPVSFTAIGRYAMGSVGLALVYVSVVVTLLGAATAYFINSNELLRETHIYLNPGWSANTAMYANTVIYMCLMYPLTCIKSLAPLSKLSFPAIVALIAGFVVIIKLGLDMHGVPPVEEVLSWDSLYIPVTFNGFSTFFGVAAFSYGATIIIPEIQESMANTDDFIGALKISLWAIWGSYSVLGGVALLIYQQAGPVSDNIMAQLPAASVVQEPLLLLITMATLFTYPLAMQPVASIFTQALIQAGFGESSENAASGQYGALSTGSSPSGSFSAAVAPGATSFGGQGPSAAAVQEEGGAQNAENSPPSPPSPDQLPPVLYYGLRAALVLFTGVCATSVPNFGVVVSLLGSFSVTLGSFVLPPLFHRAVFAGRLTPMEDAVDLVLCCIGVVTCVFTTTTTAIGVLNGED